MYRKCAYFLLLSFLLLTSTVGVFAQDKAASTQSTSNPIIIEGVETAGLARTCNPASLGALLNFIANGAATIANGAAIIGISIGSFIIIRLIVKPAERKIMIRRAGLAAAAIGGGLMFPATVNLLVSTARDLNLFS